MDLHELRELVLQLLRQFNPTLLEQQGGTVNVWVRVVLQDLLLDFVVEELILLRKLPLNVFIIVLIGRILIS